MAYIVNNVPLWSVTIWDKSFNGIDRAWQPKTIRYKYLLSDELDRLNVGGTVRLLYTGQDIGFTTEELAGDALCEGEIVSIPWGGTPSVKYYKGKFVTGDNRIATSSKPDELLNKYLYYYLRGHLRELSSYYRGAGLKHPAMKDVLKMSISYPRIEDQEKIIKQFESLEKIINLRQQELQKLDALIKARFVEMFGSVHDNRFPKCKLRELAHIKHGFAFSGEFFSDEDNGVVLVTPGNFALGGGFQENRNRYYTSDYPDEYVLHAGDLIVTMTDLSKKADTLGYGAIVPETDKVYLHNQRIGLFDRLDQRLNPVFLRWFMQTNEYRLEIVRTSTGSTVHHTSPDRILDSVVFVPPIDKQYSFVSFAKQIDKSKSVIQKSLDETQLLFDSLMQKYFG